jgi:hypothetical protein
MVEASGILRALRDQVANRRSSVDSLELCTAVRTGSVVGLGVIWFVTRRQGNERVVARQESHCHRCRGFNYVGPMRFNGEGTATGVVRTRLPLHPKVNAAVAAGILELESRSLNVPQFSIDLAHRALSRRSGIVRALVRYLS